MKNIILHIPHSAPITNADLASWSDPEAVRKEADKWTDWHTDTIFAPSTNHLDRVHQHVAFRSRYMVDMERLVNDDMEAQGQGIVYTRTKDGSSTRNVSDDARELMEAAYIHHHAGLDALTRLHDPILIDCHSFPSDYAEAGNASGEPVDICLGFNEDSTKPSEQVIDLITEHFENAGYSVGINYPFSNCIVGDPDCPSIMIELNKRIYMDENTHGLLPWAYKVQKVINDLYEKLLNL